MDKVRKPGRAISSGGYSRNAAETFYVTGVPTQLHVLLMVGSLFYLLFTARAFRVIFYLVLRSKKKKKISAGLDKIVISGNGS